LTNIEIYDNVMAKLLLEDFCHDGTSA